MFGICIHTDLLGVVMRSIDTKARCFIGTDTN